MRRYITWGLYVLITLAVIAAIITYAPRLWAPKAQQAATGNGNSPAVTAIEKQIAELKKQTEANAAAESKKFEEGFKAVNEQIKINAESVNRNFAKIQNDMKLQNDALVPLAGQPAQQPAQPVTPQMEQLASTGIEYDTTGYCTGVCVPRRRSYTEQPYIDYGGSRYVEQSPGVYMPQAMCQQPYYPQQYEQPYYPQQRGYAQPQMQQQQSQIVTIQQLTPTPQQPQRPVDRCPPGSPGTANRYVSGWQPSDGETWNNGTCRNAGVVSTGYTTSSTADGVRSSGSITRAAGSGGSVASTKGVKSITLSDGRVVSGDSPTLGVNKNTHSRPSASTPSRSISSPVYASTPSRSTSSRSVASVPSRSVNSRPSVSASRPMTSTASRSVSRPSVSASRPMTSTASRSVSRPTTTMSRPTMSTTRSVSRPTPTMSRPTVSRPSMPSGRSQGNMTRPSSNRR